MLTFYEFFAGGGMVRAGLGQTWRCLFANDFDYKKGRVYRQNWGAAELRTTDVRLLTTKDLPATASLAWASFPCQDLSLAGWGAGLKGDRSGTFWPFWNLMRGLNEERRPPQFIVLENVCGTLSSHDGKDFGSICSAFQEAEYSVGAVVVDATLFVPQSRPRLFIIGVHSKLKIPECLTTEAPLFPWHTRTLRTAYEKLPQEAKLAWIWWNFPLPPKRMTRLTDIIEEKPSSVEWFSAEEVQRLLSIMSPINYDKLIKAKQEPGKMVGTAYKRTREDRLGQKAQRAEIRFDDVSGCLRTPAGGSSRQLIVVVDEQTVKARLISSRETARLMGLGDDYLLPKNYNEAYHLTGDGVVVPVVRYLAEHILEPLLLRIPKEKSTVAA